jgi:hypothetical protein
VGLGEDQPFSSSKRKRKGKIASASRKSRRRIYHNAQQGELLTDDFAPVNLYETMPLKPRSR